MSIFYAKLWKTLDFVHYTLENPEIFMTKTLENSEKYPGKPLNLSLKFGWQLCSEKIIMAEVHVHVNVVNVFHIVNSILYTAHPLARILLKIINVSVVNT